MNLEFFLVVTALVISSAAMFVFRSVPSWVWLLLLFSLGMLPGGRIAGFHLHAPRSSREACERQCDGEYGHRDELEDQLYLCQGTCR